jgi:hypothetical protein
MSHARLVTTVPHTLSDAWRKLISAFEALHAEGVVGKRVTYTSNATPNTQDDVPHGLGKAPSGFVVLSLDKAATVYKSAAFDEVNLHLKCDVATVAVTLLAVE